VYGNARVYGDARVYGTLKIITGFFFGMKYNGETIKEHRIDDNAALLYKGSNVFAPVEKRKVTRAELVEKFGEEVEIVD